MRNLIISILVSFFFIGCSEKGDLLSPEKMKELLRSNEPSTLFKDGYICPDIVYPIREFMELEDYKKILTLSSASYTPSATSP